MLFSALATRRVIRLVGDGAVAANWRKIFALIVFFLIGYIVVLAAVLSGQTELIALLAGLVFFAGALFVYLVVNTGHVTITDLKETTVSRDDYQAVIENSLDIIGVLDSDGRLLYVSPAVRPILGYAEAELVGRSVFDYLPPEEASRVTASLIRVNQGSSSDSPRSVSNLRFVHKDGAWRDLEAVWTPLGDESGDKRLLISARDVTERNRAAEEIARLQQDYRAIVDNAVVGIFQATTDGQYITANAALVEMFGYNSFDDLRSSLFDVGRQLYVDPGRYEELLRVMQEQGPVRRFESRVRQKDGNLIWISENARIVYSTEGAASRIEGVVANVSARKQMEQELSDRVVELEQAHRSLSDSQKRLDSILEMALDVIITIDESGSIQRVNKATRELFGYSTEEMMGANISMLMPSPYREEHDGYLSRYLRTGEARVIGKGRELTGRRKDGTVFPLELSVSEVFLAGGRIFVGTLHDITESVQLQEELLANSNRLEAANLELQELDTLKDDFLSTVSHELRTPLTSLSGALVLLASGKLSMESPQVTHLLTVASRNAQRLALLVNDVLDVERMAAGRLEVRPVSVAAHELLQGAVDSLQAIADQSSIRLSIEASSGTVSADPMRLQQVLVNLIGNALKFSPEGSEIRMLAVPEGDQVRFEVEDQGRGIAPGDIDRVFGRFQQVDAVDASQRGTGLGLWISRGIVELHGGTMWARSALGSGSTFSFTLPKAEG